MKKEIINCLTHYASRMSQITQYEWGDSFKLEQIDRINKEFYYELEKYIDWDNLTEDECYDLGFLKFRIDDDFMLIPLYLVPLIPIGTELICIDGTTVKYDGKNIDNDIRIGRIAYGIRVKNEKEKNNEKN